MSSYIVGLLGILGLALTACGDDPEGSTRPGTRPFWSPPDLTIRAGDEVVALGAHSYNTADMVADGTMVPSNGPDLVVGSRDVVIEHPAGWTFTASAVSPGTNLSRTLSVVGVAVRSFRLVAPSTGGTFDVFLDGQHAAEHLGAGYVFRWTFSEPDAVSIPSVVDVLADVGYYGACGNEPLVVGGSTYYPLWPDELAALDTARYRLDGSNGIVSGIVGRLRVVPPGPGDDIGTLTVYSDGVARFESDSGRIIWLSIEPRIYYWAC